MAVTELPSIGKAVAQNQDLVKKLEVAHFQALLGGQLDQRYAESCRQTVQQEAAIGLDARIRSTAGSFMLKAALDALARKHRFSSAKLAERGKIVSQVISFDVANANELCTGRRRNRRHKHGVTRSMRPLWTSPAPSAR